MSNHKRKPYTWAARIVDVAMGVALVVIVIGLAILAARAV